MLDPAMQAFDAQMSAPGRGHAAPARAAPRRSARQPVGARRSASMSDDQKLLERRRLFQRRDGDRLVHRYRRETGVRRQVKSEERIAAGRGRPLWPRVKNS